MEKYFWLIFCILAPNSIFAQTDNPDFMRSIGMIYVVVAVLLVVFAGLGLFLWVLDRRLKRLEQYMDEEEG